MNHATLPKPKSMAELQYEYIMFLHESHEVCLDFADWLPDLGAVIERPMVPGELCFIMADTGQGKSACIQNIAVASPKLHTVLFSLELPGTLCFERFAAIAHAKPAIDVERIYREEKALLTTGDLKHIYTCDATRLNTQDMSSIIQQHAQDTGQRVHLLLVDYIGLMSSIGGRSRYEQVSRAAEDLKVLAKQTNTIVIAATQIHRKEEDSDGITIHDARDSSSIEQSCGILLGVWRDEHNCDVLNIRVCKNTKRGGQWNPVKARFDGPSLRVLPLTKRDYLPPDIEQAGPSGA